MSLRELINWQSEECFFLIFFFAKYERNVDIQNGQEPHFCSKRPIYNVKLANKPTEYPQKCCRKSLRIFFLIASFNLDSKTFFHTLQNSMVRPHELPDQRKSKDNLLFKPMIDIRSSTLGTDFLLVGSKLQITYKRSYKNFIIM